MKLFKRSKSKEMTVESIEDRELSEAEITADALNEVYGALVENIYSDKKYDKVQKNPAYIEAKDFIERKHKELDRAILIEVSSLMTLNEGLKVNFVPSKTAFVELEADFKPSKADEYGRKESFKIVKFTDKGEKVFNKYYTKEEASIIKPEREKNKPRKLSFFERLAENEYESLNDGFGRER